MISPRKRGQLMQPFPNMNYYTQPQFIPQIPQNGTRFVNSFNEISASDVPMNGGYALFCKNDMSEIQAKSWGANGLINTLTYKLENKPNNTTLNADTSNLSPNELKAENGAILDEIKGIKKDIGTLLSRLGNGGKKNESNSNN